MGATAVGHRAAPSCLGATLRQKQCELVAPLLRLGKPLLGLCVCLGSSSKSTSKREKPVERGGVAVVSRVSRSEVHRSELELTFCGRHSRAAAEQAMDRLTALEEALLR